MIAGIIFLFAGVVWMIAAGVWIMARSPWMGAAHAALGVLSILAGVMNLAAACDAGGHVGFFDDVHFSMDCPNCGERMDGFQTKDSECSMSVIEPDGIGNFYSSCRKCKAWVEFTRPRPPCAPLREKPLTLEEVKAIGFVLEVTPNV